MLFLSRAIEDLIPASHNPPKWTALGGINFHVMPFFVACSWTADSWHRARNLLFALWKFLALSLNIELGFPRRDIKRDKAAINASVVKEVHASR